MRVTNKILVYLLSLCCLTRCIDPYTPDLGNGNDQLVINGRITDQEGYQYVEVSRTTDLSESEKNPVSGCVIQIFDDRENVYNMSEVSEGRYACQMNKEDLIIGTKYKLVVLTPEGKQYQSDFEQLLACPPIDSVTYEETQMDLSNPTRSVFAVQFYINTNASGEYAKNYLWEMSEAWEYHAPYAITAYYDGELVPLPVPSFEYYTCYKSDIIDEIFIHTTQDVTNDKIQKFPLNYVTDETDRLSVKYSLNVRQYSLSDKAYNYLQTIKQLSRETGGFYETQPSSISGNIYNMEDPEEKVLGMFYASGVTEKRIFVQVYVHLYNHSCDPYGYSYDELIAFLETKDKSEYPVYVIYSMSGYDYAEQYCFDCRSFGGSTVPPDYW
jgi:hypothetical protein